MLWRLFLSSFLFGSCFLEVFMKAQSEIFLGLLSVLYAVQFWHLARALMGGMWGFSLDPYTEVSALLKPGSLLVHHLWWTSSVEVRCESYQLISLDPGVSWSHLNQWHNHVSVCRNPHCTESRSLHGHVAVTILDFGGFQGSVIMKQIISNQGKWAKADIACYVKMLKSCLFLIFACIWGHTGESKCCLPLSSSLHKRNCKIKVTTWLLEI